MRKVTKSGVSFMAVVVSLAASGSGRAGEPNSPSPGAGTEAHAPAADAARRDGIIAEARRLVEDAMSEEILPAWLGTPWSFNGVSRRPGAGNIACGSFVVFTLQDAAFRIPSRMLRQPSENIIKNLVPAGGIRRYAMQRPASEVVRDIREQGDGLYMVGLDVHVGFLVNRGGDVAFWHSTYFPPRQVIRQGMDEVSPFSVSAYRVVGRLLGDDMVRKWLNADRFEMVHDYRSNR